MGRFMQGGERRHHSVPHNSTNDPGESGQFVVGEHDHAAVTSEEQTLGEAENADTVAPESRADAWTTCSSAYQAFAAGLTRPFAWDAVRLVRIETGSNVLDVATGTGEFAIAAAERGADVLATDFSASMLELVETSRRRPPVGSIRTALMDGQALALETHAFDAAGSLFGLVFFPNPAQGLSEMFRVLKPGGQAVIATWAIPSHVELMRIVGDALMQLDCELPGRASPESCWTSLSSPRRLTQLMADAGFHSVHVVALAHVWTFDHVDLFARSVLQMTPSWMDLYRRMTRQQKAGFTHALVQSFRDRQGSGPYAVTAQGLVAVGTKNR